MSIPLKFFFSGSLHRVQPRSAVVSEKEHFNDIKWRIGLGDTKTFFMGTQEVSVHSVRK